MPPSKSANVEHSLRSVRHEMCTVLKNTQNLFNQGTQHLKIKIMYQTPDALIDTFCYNITKCRNSISLVLRRGNAKVSLEYLVFVG